MERLPVMVTGIGGGGVGEQILKCLKMSSNDYYIVGGDMNQFSKGLAIVDKPYILPPASADRYVDALLAVCKRHGVKALFYGSEPELKVMSQYRELFAQHDIFIPLCPQSVIDTCMDKNKTMRWFHDNGFCMPRSEKVVDAEALSRIDFIPAVLKPSIGGGGSANSFVARNADELKLFGTYLLELYGEFIVQEYVGSYDSEYTVGVLCDLQGKYINSIAVKKSILSGLSNRIKVKNTSGVAKHGEVLAISSGISQGQIGRFAEVTEPCRKIAEKLGVTGPVNIQCRVQDGQVYVFEINPRISGTSSLRAMVGYNEPDIMIRRHLLGESIPVDFPYREGIIVRGLDETLLDINEVSRIERA